MKWLTELKLIKYKDLLIQGGFIEPLFLVACTEEELAELGISDPTDRCAFSFVSENERLLMGRRERDKGSVIHP